MIVGWSESIYRRHMKKVVDRGCLTTPAYSEALLQVIFPSILRKYWSKRRRRFADAVSSCIKRELITAHDGLMSLFGLSFDLKMNFIIFVVKFLWEGGSKF